MPEYVAYELVYKNSKDLDTMESSLALWARLYGSLDWKYVPDFTVSPETLDSESLYSIKGAIQSSSVRKPDKVLTPGQEKQLQRYEKQREMLKQGISKEPIIVEPSRYEPGKFELLEGYHRTTEAFRLYPDGFQCPAWVGYPTKQSAEVEKQAKPGFLEKVKKIIKRKS